MIILQLALALFISKIYYDLAVSNNENGWLFGILGIATYFIGGALLGLITFSIISILKLYPRYSDKTASALISVTLSLYHLNFKMSDKIREENFLRLSQKTQS